MVKIFQVEVTIPSSNPGSDSMLFKGLLRSETETFTYSLAIVHYDSLCTVLFYTLIRDGHEAGDCLDCIYMFMTGKFISTIGNSLNV